MPGAALVPPLLFHSSGGTHKRAHPVPRMCVGSEVGLVLTHAGSHVALLACGLAEPMVPGRASPREQAHATAAPFQHRRGSPGRWHVLTRVVLPEVLEHPRLVQHLYFLFFSFVYVS